MKKYFQKYEWTKASVLEKIEELMKKHSEAKYKFLVGHHPIGFTNKTHKLLF